MKKKIDDVRFELIDAFVEEKWFYNVKVNKALVDDVYEIELIVNEYFNIYNLNDVKDELSYNGFKVYDENYFITKTKVNENLYEYDLTDEIIFRFNNVKPLRYLQPTYDDVYSVKFFVKEVRE